ncbi:single-stranded DNA-binding protein [Bifidobacterium animalis subsp. animalis MCC 0499]|uniref:single-stranded DNA-binding protein n=1 Tax=Bifidobacterium animalis TaxID=28025 RepID=UPI00069C2B27|nr:single-stranded DNA-binding protein [Bifidobacterium animalis]KOA60789.1 single-stranded DNA-binding protein [Bifidobacterium animalis subsp. animalis MCC 0499]
MAGETMITVIGNLTRDPELRTIASGATVVNFTIASSTRTFNRDTNQWEDSDTLFLNCSAWDRARHPVASNIANSLSKGTRVIAHGNLTQRSYQAQDGTQHTVVELRVSEIGVSLDHATCMVKRQQFSTPDNQTPYGMPAQSSGGYQGGASQANTTANSSGVTDPFNQPTPDDDPWATPSNPTSAEQEPEF